MCAIYAHAHTLSSPLGGMTMSTERNISSVHNGLASGYISDGISDTSCDSTTCRTVSYRNENNGTRSPQGLAQGEIVGSHLLSILQSNVNILQLYLNNFQNRSAFIVPHTVSSVSVPHLEDTDTIFSYHENGNDFTFGDREMDIRTDELFSGSGNEERIIHNNMIDKKNNDEAVTEENVVDLENFFEDEDMDTDILLAIDNNTIVLSEELKKDVFYS